MLTCGIRKFPFNLGSINPPIQICWLGTAVSDWPRHAKTCRRDVPFFILQKLLNNGVKTRIVGTWKSMVAFDAERIAIDGEYGEIALGAADVTGEDELGLVGHGDAFLLEDRGRVSLDRAGLWQAQRTLPRLIA